MKKEYFLLPQSLIGELFMVTYRNYQEMEDLELQRDFWMEVTKELPWAWKPNKSQLHFAQKPIFDPRTKVFAFEKDTLIGYMSCIKHETFIPFGYPWVRKSFEGEVQEELYQRIYDLAVGPLNGTSFLQRFREEWNTQINFFLNKGFNYAFGYPIYIRNLDSPIDPIKTKFTTKIHSTLPNDILINLASKDSRYAKDNLSELTNFYRDIDFDLIISLHDDRQVISLAAVTNREDTGYSEMNLIVVDEDYSTSTDNIIQITLEELQNRHQKHVSITLEEDDSIIETMERFGFSKRSKSVFYRKEIE